MERLLSRRQLAIQSDFYHYQLQNLLETHRVTKSRHCQLRKYIVIDKEQEDDTAVFLRECGQVFER